MAKSSKPATSIQWDLLWTGIIAILLTVLIYFLPSVAWLKPIRLVIGLPFVLFLPGYWFINALLPAKEDLDIVERLGLSLGLSIAWIPVLALILDQLPWGLRLKPILLSEIVLISLFMMIAFVRRTWLLQQNAYIPEFTRPKVWWKFQTRSNRLTYIVVVIVMGLAIAAVAWIFLTPSPADFMTEFYILGPEGLAENYPRKASIGETLSVTVGITNREKENHTYSIEVWVEDPWEENQRERTGSIQQFTLSVGKTIEFPIQWFMPWSGKDKIVEFLLYIDDEPDPYRKLRLWINVEEGMGDKFDHVVANNVA
jgi:uncharacterized membrane protein